MAIHCSQPYLLVILIIRNQNPEAGCRTPTEHQDTALPPQTISPSSPPPPSHLPNNLETAVCPQINIQCSEPPPPPSLPNLAESFYTKHRLHSSNRQPGPYSSVSQRRVPPSGKTALALFFPRGDSAAHRESGLHTSIKMDLVVRKSIFSFSSERASC